MTKQEVMENMQRVEELKSRAGRLRRAATVLNNEIAWMVDCDQVRKAWGMVETLREWAGDKQKEADDLLFSVLRAVSEEEKT